MKYAVWLACERIGTLPPNVENNWDDNSEVMQANILAYGQIRSYEDQEARGN